MYFTTPARLPGSQLVRASILALFLLGCAPSTGFHSIPADARTAHGNGVQFGDLQPGLQQEALARIDSEMGGEFPGWSVTIGSYPLVYPGPVAPLATGRNTDGRLIVTSYTDLQYHIIHLSWRYNKDGTLWLEDLAYELANVKCGCESGLQKKVP